MKIPTKSKNAKLIFYIILAIGFVTAVCYVAGISLMVPFLLLVAGFFLFYLGKASVKLFLELGLLLTLIVFATYTTITYYPAISYFYVPVASVAMLTILLYGDLEISFVMAVLSSIFVGLIVGGDFNFMLITFIGSISAVYMVKDARTRGRLIEAGVIVGILQVFCYLILNLSDDFKLSKHLLLDFLKPLLANGLISVITVMVTAKIFESLFGVLTNFSLLELSDFNHPLLKRLVLEAPGTYHHSLVVSNLAESAANAIGANALLTKVGAYYHDVGKMVKPEYFTENQLIDGSKHDSLEPTISRLVILNHVKEGVDLANKYKLSPRIVDFIPQHHGTGIIYYFYQRALEGAEEGETVNQENFRYPGPKPQTKETAIVLLADSVEGAVRSLDDPNANRIDEIVRKVVNNKFIDGQLDECDLTLKEIEKICSTFTRVLTAMYHTRIKYPEKKNGNGHQPKKPTEANSFKSSPNSKNRRDNSAP